MALFRIRATIAQITGLSADRVNWGFGVTGDAPSAEEMEVLYGNFYDACTPPVSNLNSFLGDGLIFQSLECYPAAGGEAVAFASPNNPGEIGAGTPHLPAECAVVLSQLIATTRGLRPKGRTFIGPFAANALATEGMVSGPGEGSCIEAVLDFASHWWTSLVAVGLIPCVISANGLVNRGVVEAYRVDNAWDTQRRRGTVPTQFATRTVGGGP